MIPVLIVGRGPPHIESMVLARGSQTLSSEMSARVCIAATASSISTPDQAFKTTRPGG